MIKEPNGVLIVNKHKGVTSHDIVNKVRHLYGTKRVGHTGTLDPMATGVLVVLVGRAAKAAEYLVSDFKEYRAILHLGITSDTEDITGKILSENTDIPSESRVKEVCSHFIGKIQQIPPMYSALKVGGRKLCDLARQGENVERAAREIEIFSLDCQPTENISDYILTVKCSSGTYIRTLCADIGRELGCGGVMAGLCRTEAGGFSIDSSHSIEEIENIEVDKRKEILIPTQSLFKALPSVTFSEFYERLFRNGCEIYLKKIYKSFAIGQRVSVYDKNGSFYALGEVREYKDGPAIKQIKLFDL